MKLYIEIILIFILIVLMYTKSSAIDSFVQSILGKITLVITLIGVTAQCG